MSAADFEPQGDCAPGYEAVKDAFRANFRDHDEVGASFALWSGGEVVADLWGGWADGARRTPWARDTLTNIWSATKAVSATCYAMLVDRGLASYEDPVARYWPEFGAAGKAGITIGMLLSHQAGLSGFTTPATVRDLLGGEASAARLAAQSPVWEPGTAPGYHGLSLGLLLTALCARIEGRSIQRFVAEELAGPWDFDLSIGLTPSDTARVAEMLVSPGVDSRRLPAANPAQAAARNPTVTGALSNDPAWRAADLPSANGFGNARALAALFAQLLWPEGRTLVSSATLAEAIRCRIEGMDLVKGAYARWAAGFSLNADGLWGPNPRTFGHAGWGGTFVFADPDAGIVAAYAMNRMSDLFDNDPRRRNLINAAFARRSGQGRARESVLKRTT